MAHLKLAFRRLAKTPFITGIAVVSLALGIGANAAIFSLFHQLLLSPLPVPEPDRLVNLGAPGPKPGSQSCNQAGDCEQVFSYPMFRDLQREQRSFTGLAAHRAISANVVVSDRTVNGEGMLVSGSYFPVLGLRPALGRLLMPSDDDKPGAHPVAVVGYRFWQSELGADPGILNRTLVLNGTPFTVVGVAPQGFEGTTLGTRPDVYVPLSMRGQAEPYFPDPQLDNRRSYWAYVFGRLKPGVTMEQAATELNASYHAIVDDVEAPLQDGMSAPTLERFKAKKVMLADGRRGQSSVHHEARTPLILLFGITGVVLLIACANIANLLLARGASRGQEMAIRGSLGASRRQLLTQLLSESVLLALLGGAASLLVAHWTLALVGSLLPPETAQIMQLHLSTPVMLFTAGLSLGTGLIFGMYPALHATRPDLVTTLKSASGQPAGARAAARFRTSLVTAQIALSMALLVSAGLFIQSLLNVSRVDLGLNADHVVEFGVSPVLNGYEPARSLQLFGSLERELSALPEVTGVSAAMVPVLSGSNWGTDVSVQGFEKGPDTDDNSRYNEVGPGYFHVMEIPLLAGREFDEGDAEGAEKVAIVNEAFVRKFGLDPGSAVGSYIGSGPSDSLDTRIVGLVRDAKYSDVKDEVPPLFFRPYRQDAHPPGIMTFYVRSATDPAAVMKAIPPVVKRLDSSLPVENLKTLDQQVRENVFLDRMIGTLSAAFAALATLLAAVGLYGVLAYTVAQRTREIGLRMALGAGSDKVRRMVLGEVGRMVVVGGVIGIVAALFLGKAAQSLLFGMKGNEPWVVVVVSLVLAVVALAAGYVPALRASRVDPMQALRYE